jgi:hypothetical protein
MSNFEKKIISTKFGGEKKKRLKLRIYLEFVDKVES